MAYNYHPDHDQSDDTMSLPPIDPPSWRKSTTDDSEAFNQDRYRLARELAQDFENASFSDVAPPGEETDTIASGASFDIGRDANATSTKRLSPRIPTRAPAGPPDFTMAGEDNSDMDSYEMGRARGGAVSFRDLDQTTDMYSIGGSARKNESKKRAGGNRLPSQEFKNRNDKQSKPRLRPTNVDRSLGSPVSRTSAFPNLSFSPPSMAPKRVQPRKLSGGSGERPSKISDFVSNSGSGGSRDPRVANSRDSEEDALSDIGSARPQFVNPRFQPQSAGSSPGGRRLRNEDLTGDIPAVLARTRKSNSADAVPKSFKSTTDFLKELGLDGHTQTINLQDTLKQLKDIGPTANSQPTSWPQKQPPTPARNLNFESTFMIPNLPDMTDLFSGNDATRFSAKKGAAAKTHHPLDSIPIPHETRAMLTAMKLLQEKVASLEDNKVANELKCAKLESELRRTEARYQQETRRARLAMEEMRKRGMQDSTFGGSEDGGDQDKTRVDFMMEKLKLESTITTLQDDIQQIQQQLATAKVALRNMQEERNAAIQSVAMAISSNEDLKAANHNLQVQLDQMQHEQRQYEKKSARKHEEYLAREEKLRQRAREARQAAMVAEQAMKETARRGGEAQEAVEREAALRHQEEAEKERQDLERQMQEQLEEEREEQRRREIKWEFDRRVEEELRKIRPDLFEGREKPFEVPSPPAPASTSKETIEVDGRRRVIAVPKSRRSQVPPNETPEIHHTAQAAHPTPAQFAPEVTSPAVGDDTSMSISPEEIRRIAKEINAERKKRKAAAAEKARQEAERQQELERQREADRILQEAAATPIPEAEAPAPVQTKKHRKVVKVITYLTDDNTTEILREIENEFGGGHFVEDVQSASESTTTSLPPAPVEKPIVQPEPKLARPEPAHLPAETSIIRESAPSPESTQHFPIHVESLHDSPDHDPSQCTVCVRYASVRRREEEAERENPLRDIDNSCLFPAPSLEAASKRPVPEGEYNEEPTLRPSMCPRTQLERVVRQLKDEFKHLKMMYQQKSEIFMSLDPAVQKKKRKALTRQMNELVAEMDAKSDQIYALYDVNEEFAARENERQYQMGEETEDLIRSLTV